MTTSQTTTKEILVLAHRFSSCANDLPITLVLESCSGKSFVDIVFWLIAPSKSINNYFAAICSHVWFPDRQAHEFCCFDEVFSIKNTCFIILDFTSIFFCVYQILVSGCFSQTLAGNTKTSCTAEVVWANSWLCRTSQGPRRSFGTVFFSLSLEQSYDWNEELDLFHQNMASCPSRQASHSSRFTASSIHGRVESEREREILCTNIYLFVYLSI